MSNTNSQTKGSYRTDYRDEECMKFTAKDQAVLDRLAKEEQARKQPASVVAVQAGN